MNGIDAPVVRVLVMKMSNSSAWVWGLFMLHQVLHHCFPWLSGVCITASHLCHCKHLHFMFLSLLVISISGICLMAWDSLVNRSHDKQPLFAQPLDYVFREQCISVQQYVISACVELCWRLWTFNKNSIKNDAGHGAEGRAAKSPLKRVQIHPCARLSSWKHYYV